MAFCVSFSAVSAFWRALRARLRGTSPQAVVQPVELLVERVGFSVLQNNLKNGACPRCSTAIPGRW